MRPSKRKGPKTCGDLFKKGYWTNMIAERLNTSTTMVEVALMQRIRQLERQIKRMGGK
jgi:hypothetical protein